MAAVGGFPGQDHTHELNVYRAASAHRVTVADPYTDASVDVTGWDLDHVAEQAAQVWNDASAGYDRELTQDECDVLDLDNRAAVWATSDMIVQIAADRMLNLAHEAIQQRDLAAFWAATERGEEPSARAKFAHQAYVAETSHDDRPE